MDKRIWDFLKSKGLSDCAVAGIMGNLYAESGLSPCNLQNVYEKKLGMTDAQYTTAVDNGSYTGFVNDCSGYGLAQWTYFSRKQALLDFARAARASIGSLEMQLNFLWKELQGYTYVIQTLKAAKTVLEASNAVLCGYERPANQGAEVQAKRAAFGQKYIDKFAGTPSKAGKTEGGKTRMKIMLDPGHYGKANQSPANKAYYESEAMWKLCGYLKSALEARGITVGVTRTNAAVDRPVFERGKAAAGYDLFISLHSNAVGNNGTNEATDYPVVYVPLNKKGDAVGKKLAAVVEKTMGTKQNGRIATREGSNGTDYYGVIRGAVAVGVVGILIEHSFHTQTAATNWLLSDSNLQRLANAQAAVIAEHYGVGGATHAPVPQPTTSPTTPKAPANPPYVVKVTADTLNIRTGPGTNYGVVRVIKDKGAYTIVEEASGTGAKRWGKLKSGSGWISLDYTEKR